MTILSIIVADHTIDGTGMKAVMNTDNISVISYDREDCDRAEATDGRSHTQALCHSFKLREGVSTQTTKSMFKPFRECLCVEVYTNPLHTTAVENFYH